MKNLFCRTVPVLLIILQICSFKLFAKAENENTTFDTICAKVESSFKKADIPGLSLIFIDEDKVYIKNWGYADIENQIPVGSQTLFELGSTSKAFTALAILQLVEDDIISLDDNVSKYIQWFKVFYKNKEVQITIKDLIQHVSGIPTESMSKIPAGDSDDMLEKTVKAINKIELKHKPGTTFEYATINYDILGLVIEIASKLSFEEYLTKKIFQPLNLNNTYVGSSPNNSISKGYKISFYSPKQYNAPIFRGNFPAGYIF